MRGVKAGVTGLEGEDAAHRNEAGQSQPAMGGGRG
jgi:hypothetical protein